MPPTPGESRSVTSLILPLGHGPVERWRWCDADAAAAAGTAAPRRSSSIRHEHHPGHHLAQPTSACQRQQGGRGASRAAGASPTKAKRWAFPLPLLRAIFAPLLFKGYETKEWRPDLFIPTPAASVTDVTKGVQARRDRPQPLEEAEPASRTRSPQQERGGRRGDLTPAGAGEMPGATKPRTHLSGSRGRRRERRPERRGELRERFAPAPRRRPPPEPELLGASQVTVLARRVEPETAIGMDDDTRRAAVSAGRVRGRRSACQATCASRRRPNGAARARSASLAHRCDRQRLRGCVDRARQPLRRTRRAWAAAASPSRAR